MLIAQYDWYVMVMVGIVILVSVATGVSLYWLAVIECLVHVCLAMTHALFR